MRHTLLFLAVTLSVVALASHAHAVSVTMENVTAAPGSSVTVGVSLGTQNTAGIQGWQLGGVIVGSAAAGLQVTAARIPPGLPTGPAPVFGASPATGPTGDVGFVSSVVLSTLAIQTLPLGVFRVAEFDVSIPGNVPSGTTFRIDFRGGGQDIFVVGGQSLPFPSLVSGSITVIRPNQPPDCSDAVLMPSECWPPNHTFVMAEVLGVTDPDGDPVTISVDRITQDEPVRSTARGSGHTCPDGMRVDADGDGNPERAALRCERDGRGNGRVYTVHFTATDPAGASCTGSATFCVPHDRSNGCVDDGQQFNSMICPDGGSGGGFITLAEFESFATEPLFLRGDVDWDEERLISDGVIILDRLFRTGEPFDCADAADVNDDGQLDLSDAVGLFSYLFLGSFTPPPPVEWIGPDPSPDRLTCTSDY